MSPLSVWRDMLWTYLMWRRMNIFNWFEWLNPRLCIIVTTLMAYIRWVPHSICLQDRPANTRCKNINVRKPHCQCTSLRVLEFFTNPPQYENPKITNFVLAVPLQINWSNEDFNLEIWSFYNFWSPILHWLTLYGASNEGNCKYMAIQSCVFVKISIAIVFITAHLIISFGTKPLHVQLLAALS